MFLADPKSLFDIRKILNRKMIDIVNEEDRTEH